MAGTGREWSLLESLAQDLADTCETDLHWTAARFRSAARIVSVVPMSTVYYGAPPEVGAGVGAASFFGAIPG